MTTIKFETGETVKFDGTPTQQDVEEVASKLGIIKKKEAEPKKSNFLSSTGPSFKADEGGVSGILPNLAKTIGNIPSSARDLAKATLAPVNPFDIQSPINIGSNLSKSASAVSDIVKQNGILGGLKSVAGGVIDTAKKGIDLYKSAGEKIYNSLEKNVLEQDSVRKGLQTSGVNAVSDAAKVGIENPLLIPSMIYGGEAMGGKKDLISKIASPVVRNTDTGLLNTASRLTSKSESQIESAIINKFEKGVKPLLSNKTTPTKLAQYKSDVVNAVQTINENKPNLSFSNEFGDVITGQNPQSLQELTHAIEQTKKSIFSKYNGLAKEAGEAGVTVNMTPIASELDTVIGNKALSITNPRSIQYAQELKDRLTKVGKLDAETAQEVIQNYNKSLEAFYRNPSYDTASQAAIDSMIANKMRKTLDDGISGLTGESYQALKKQYGSLKSVEKDVVKASLRDARKNIKGFLDFADIFSGGQIVNGILSLNPAIIAQGVAQKGISSFYKHLNNPNRAIQKMFRVVEKSPQFQNSTPSSISNIAPTQITNPSASVPISPRNINKTGFSETNVPSTSKKQIYPSGNNTNIIPSKLPLLQKKASGKGLLERFMDNFGAGGPDDTLWPNELSEYDVAHLKELGKYKAPVSSKLLLSLPEGKIQLPGEGILLGQRNIKTPHTAQDQTGILSKDKQVKIIQ